MMDVFLRDNVERLLGGKKEAPSPEFLGKLESALRTCAPARPRERLRPLSLLWQMSLAAVALAGLGLLLLFPREPLHQLSRGSVRLGDGRKLVAPASVKASSPCELLALEDSQISLSDGSVAHVRSGARMEIAFGDRSMKQSLVIALLAGSASFHNPRGKVEAVAGQVAILEPAEAPRVQAGGEGSKHPEGREFSAPEVVAWMEKETKRKFIYSEDMGLRNKKVKGDLDTRDPERAYEIGLSLLKTIDVAAVPIEDGEGTVRLVPSPVAMKYAKAYTTVQALPKADEFCTLSIPLKYASAREVQAVLINKISFPQNCLAIESPPTIFLSDYASNLRVLAGMVTPLEVRQTSLRVALAILEGTNDTEPRVPEEFRNVDVAGAVGRNRFVLLAESSASLSAKGNVRGKPSPSVLRLTGPVPILAEFMGSARGERGITLSELTLRRDVTPPAPGPVLSCQVDLELGAWRILGSITGEKEGSVLVFLARATRDP